MTITQEKAFESAIEAHLLGNGWGKVAPGGYDRKLGLFPDELVAFVKDSQPKAWQQLEQRHGGTEMAREKFLAVVVKNLEQRGTLDVLRNPVKDSGVTVRLCYFKPASGLNDDMVRKYAANRCGVVRQLHHSESNPRDSLDLVLVANGIPVATAELKNTISGQSIEHAMAQYRTDRNPADLIFAQRTLVHFAVDPHQVAMTTRLDREKTRFLPFNQGSAGPGNPGGAGNPATKSGYQTAYLWEQVWQRDTWLDLLGSFLHVSTTDAGDTNTAPSERRILFPRFHQWHAVRTLLDATREFGAGVDRLVQHSAGSGKSNTIAWSAHALSKLHGADDVPIFDKVVVITDRKVLDRQLQETVAGLEHVPGTIVRIDKNTDQLRDALEGNAARVIITTLQKFPVVVAKAKEEALNPDGTPRDVAGKRFAVIIDEAHSSTSGNAMKDLKSVLDAEDPLAAAEAEQDAAEEADDASDLLLASARQRGKSSNLSFFAFTATPKPKTLELFGQVGPDGQVTPFHTYSMRQAIDEGFILDVLANYTTYGVYYRLANTDPRADIEVEKSKGKAALARFASLHSYGLDAKAEVIVEHFRQKTMAKINGHAKAMIVTRSRLHALRTHAAIQRYIDRMGYNTGPDAMKILIAFSGPVTDPAIPEATFTEGGVNGFPESQLPKRFKDDEYRLLIVAEKYQTGFDEPLLHTMYVDKKLSGVKAVQTLSRLNRTTPGKEDTFVLDFANTADEIQAAFQPFYEQSFATPTDPNILYTAYSKLTSAGILSPPEMELAVDLLLEGDSSRQAHIYANVGTAEGRFITLAEQDSDAAEDFRATLDHFCRAYGFLAQTMPWTDTDLERLYLYGRLLLTQLPAREGDPMPQISDSVHLTHLRLATNHQGGIDLTASDEPGVALPGEGKGKQAEPVLDKLSALIASMNDTFGADLGDADKIWVDQQKTDLKTSDTMRAVALDNDRSGYELALEQYIGDALIDRHEANGHLVDMFFEKPGFKKLLLSYLSDSYDEFRTEARA